MPMAKSYPCFGDALLHRRLLRRARLRDLSHEDDGKDEADAKNVDSKHNLLFQGPPTSASAGIAARWQIWGDRATRVAARGRNHGDLKYCSDYMQHDSAVPYVTCLNTHHTLASNSSMNIVVRLTCLISPHFFVF